MTANGSRLGRSGGFTLLELIVTAAMALILLSFAVLNGSRFRAEHRLRSAARQVATDLRLVRAKAITQNEEYRVRFTAGSSAYFVNRRDPATGSWEPHALYSKQITAAGPVPLYLEPPARSASTITIGFGPRGGATNGTIRLADPGLGDVTMDVEVTLAGRVATD
jgi:prepilin-type N-terminal cleavage/methylation domain-containing protein